MEDPPLPHTRRAGMEGKLVNQSGTRTTNIWLECDECGFRTEDPLKFSKNVNNKKFAPKLIFFNENKIEKDSNNF